MGGQAGGWTDSVWVDNYMRVQRGARWGTRPREHTRPRAVHGGCFPGRFLRVAVGQACSPALPSLLPDGFPTVSPAPTFSLPGTPAILSRTPQTGHRASGWPSPDVP